MEYRRIVNTTAVRPEPSTAGTLELDGYPGPAGDGLFRLYRDLGLERYVEVPCDAVVHASEPSTAQGRVTVRLRAAAQLMYVTRVHVTPSASITRAIVVPPDAVKQAARGCQALADGRWPRSSSGAAGPNYVSFDRGDDGIDSSHVDCEVALQRCVDQGIGAPGWCWLDLYWCRAMQPGPRALGFDVADGLAV
jgi:hypothetical protein